MNLDPSVSPIAQVLAASAVCIWIAAIGAPLAHATFGQRPRLVWPFYAPILGLAVVLLTTNLLAYLAHGVASAWLSLLAPSALSAVVALRGRAFVSAFKRSTVGLLALAIPAAAAFFWVLANYTHMEFGDPHWHMALVQRLARAGVPPVTPYGVDSGISYHYGAYLMAAGVVNAAGVPAWTSLAVLVSFVVVALVLAAVGFAWDVGAPLPLAIGAGAAIGLFAGEVHLGLPPYVEAAGQSETLAGPFTGLARDESASAFGWPHFPARALALGLVILVAAALEAGTGRRQAAIVAAAAGVFALAEASIMIFAGAALGVVTIVRLVKLPGRQRLTWMFALMVVALLIALAGGPLSDSLFGRGGTSGLVRIAFEPDWSDVALFERAGPALVRVGVVPLILVGGVMALRRSSWGLAFLAAAGGFALVESAMVQSSNPIDDSRVLYSAKAIGLLAVVVSLGCVVPGYRGARRAIAVLAVLLIAVLPTVVPQAIPGARLASEGFRAGRPSTDGSDYPFIGLSPLHGELAANWDFYQRLYRALPVDARLLTTHPSAVASIAGVRAPTSGPDMQLLSPWVTPIYEDAIRSLHRDDLQAMGITHLHVTDALAMALTPEARRLLDDSAHFRPIADLRSVSGIRHRLYELMPNAGTREAAASSYRALRDLIPREAPVVLLDGLTESQRRMLLYTLIDQDELQAPSTYVTRVTRRPSINPVARIPLRGEDVYVALSERADPLALGFARHDAVWAASGMRVYHMASAWSPVIRIGTEFAEPSAHLRSECQAATGRMELRLFGEPGTRVVAGSSAVELTGTTRDFDLTTDDCEKLLVFASRSPDHAAPFVQVRKNRQRVPSRLETPTAGLGIDGGVEGEKAILNLWYRNPHNLPFSAETEFRLYEVGPSGTTVANLEPHDAIRWWPGPLDLQAATQMSRVELDTRDMRINGDQGLGLANEIIRGGTYLLTLNVSHGGARSLNIVIQQQIPVLRVHIGESGASMEVFSGITSVQLWTGHANDLVFNRPDDADVHLDFTP